MSLAKFRKEIEKLPKTEKRTVFVGEDLEEVEKRTATWNLDDDRLAEIVSDKYQIVQHQEFFGEVAQAVESLIEEMEDMSIKHYNLHDEREAAYTEIVFDRELSVEGILTGLRAGNSFDKTCRAFIEVYALRQVCINGMMGKALFGRAGRLHVGDIEAEKLVTTFKEDLPKAEENLESVRNKARSDVRPYDFEELKEIFEVLRLGKRHYTYVLENVESKQVSRWDLYNVATRYIEHEVDRSEDGREKLHRQANALLTNSFEELEAEV